jgi:sugar transferase (PEP-CTERM/EpsH1 system associated)
MLCDDQQETYLPVREFPPHWFGPRGRPRILYLVHRLPYPLDKGDRIRSFHLLRYLARRASIHLACLADEPVAEGVVDVLGQYAERVAIVRVGGWSRWARAVQALTAGRTATEGAFSSPELRAIVSTWAAQASFHATLASSSAMVPYQRLPALRDVPAVVDLVDVDSQKWFDYAQASRGPRAWLYRTEGRRLRQLEQPLPGWARGVALVGEAEAERYREFCAPGMVRAITNGVDFDYFRPTTPSHEPVCAFVGALDYLPNIDGATWFCREVWPQVRQRRPEAKVLLIGRQPAPAIERLRALPGVELVGQVPDIRPSVARAAVAVVPLRIARGIQNKALEPLAMAKPTIVSPPALTGLRAVPGAHLLMASSPAEWVEAILRLFDDKELCRRLGTGGRRYVEENHCWDRCLSPFADLLGLPREPAGGVGEETGLVTAARARAG